MAAGDASGRTETAHKGAARVSVASARNSGMGRAGGRRRNREICEAKASNGDVVIITGKEKAKEKHQATVGAGGISGGRA